MFIFTIWDVIVLIVFILLSAPALFIWLKGQRTQAKCKHDEGVSETMSCDAICKKCGKNLGFIGAWRARDQASNPKQAGA